jgi:retron-type reverse transcriptase
MTLFHSAVSDRRVLKLLRQWLQSRVLVDGVVTETVTGTTQGGVISPLLANVYLHAFDRAWQEAGHWARRPLCGRLRGVVFNPETGRRSPAPGHRHIG